MAVGLLSSTTVELRPEELMLDVTERRLVTSAHAYVTRSAKWLEAAESERVDIDACRMTGGMK
jgi:hypothetical protein